MAAETTAEAFDAALEESAATHDEGEGDWLLELFNAPPRATTTSPADAIKPAPSLFKDDTRSRRWLSKSSGATARWRSGRTRTRRGPSR